ncbi:HD domain-containing phosphohydrolase [Anaerorhabdus sp.]|uniref:HD domain-containing phosphohydrolase n=1 Tax=Anaerorhabdus sp. TaxID=1872524 RepID=UPI002FC62287
MGETFFVFKENYEKTKLFGANGDTSCQICQDDNLEVLLETMPKGTVGYLYTIKNSLVEFTYILEGVIEFQDGQNTIILKAGDVYYHHSLKYNQMFRVIETTKILNLNTGPYFQSYEEDENNLMITLENLQKIDGDTLNHCIRVRRLCLGIIYFLHINIDQLDNLYYAAIFHDVGKAKIPPEILLKPGKLDADEYEVMKKHSQYTYEMIKEHYGETIAEIAYQHHEKLDGTGYPRGLKADEICLLARVIAVADAYDAMVVTRPYHVGKSQQDALKEFRRCEGTQFDGQVIDALEKYISTLD